MIHSLSPSVYPSSTPSGAPIGSEAPSEGPTEGVISILTTFVPFEYDVWYPPDRFSEQDIKGFVIGNVTNAFRDTLLNELPLLPIVNNFGLDLSTTENPSVDIDTDATGTFERQLFASSSWSFIHNTHHLLATQIYFVSLMTCPKTKTMCVKGECAMLRI